jgi:hypothetical protein
MALIGESIYRSPNAAVEPLETKIQKGCKIAGVVLRAAEDPQEQDYLNTLVTPALLGAAWQDAFTDDIVEGPNDLMYRVLPLPRLDVMQNTEPNFAQSVWLAGVVHVEETGAHRPFVYSNVKIDEHIISIMRTRRSHESLGSASLWLGTTPVARMIESGLVTLAEGIQHQVRETSYKMTETTLKLAHKIGSLPTIGQFDDAYSPLTVEFMRNGPEHLREKFLETFESSAA